MVCAPACPGGPPTKQASLALALAQMCGLRSVQPCGVSSALQRGCAFNLWSE
jgi:hypothetical protein